MPGIVEPDVREGDGAPDAQAGPSSPRQRRRWWLLAAVGVLAVGAIALAAVLGGSDGDPGGAPTAEPTATVDTTPGPEREQPSGSGAEGAPQGDEAGETDEADATPGDPDLAEADALLDVLVGPDPALAPVDLDASADSADGVRTSLDAVERVTAEAQGPGEVAGPGVRLTIVLANDGDEAVALDQVVVNLYAGAEALPGEPMLSQGTPFSGALEPGATASGQYVFTLPEAEGDGLHVTVSHDPAAPTAVFTGRVPAAG